MRSVQITSFDDLQNLHANHGRADAALALAVGKGNLQGVQAALRSGASPLATVDSSGSNVFLLAAGKPNAEELLCELLNLGNHPLDIRLRQIANFEIKLTILRYDVQRAAALNHTGLERAIGGIKTRILDLFQLLCRCAQISPWWVAGMFVPFLNIAACVYVYGKLAEGLGKNFWAYGLGMFALGIPMFLLAWDNSRPVNTPVLR